MKLGILSMGVGLLLAMTAVNADAGKLINEHLPEWVQVDLQLRYRYEFKDNFDFSDSTDDDKGFSLGRTRLNISLMPIEEIKFFYQFQDSRLWQDSISGSKAGFEDWGETRQIWVEAKTDKLGLDAVNLTQVGIKGGRQELSYGAQRLVGGFNWSNIAQTFDAGKVMLAFNPIDFNIDIFAGTKTPNKTPREADDFYDGSTNDLFAGYYATYKGVEKTTIEQYLLKRKTNKNIAFGPVGAGELDEYTLGARIKGNIGDSRFDYEFEAAKQWGDQDALDIDAAMAVAILGYTFDHAWKPRLSFEFDYASGDSDSSDGDRETFDNLFPTNHLHYGYMDLASLQNLNNYRFQLTAKPMKKLAVQGDVHLIYVDTSKDDFYSAGRTTKRSTMAGAGTHVGNEVDLKAKYNMCDYANVLVGYSHFFAGDFLSDTGANDDADFVYVQTTLNF